MDAANAITPVSATIMVDSRSATSTMPKGARQLPGRYTPIEPGPPPVLVPGVTATLANTADPMPQALVLTAIVIGFAMTALFLVVLLASRGLSGTDHVDGGEKKELAE